MIDQILYFVERDYGRLGRAFIEIDRDQNSRQFVIDRMVAGEYQDVVTVLEMNPAAGVCKDVTDEIYAEVQFAQQLAIVQDIFDAQAARFDHSRDLRKHMERV